MIKRNQHRVLRVLMYSLLWSMIAFVLYFYMQEQRGNRDDLLFLKSILSIVGIFYLNYYVFIPRLLSKRRFVEYGLAVISALLLVFVLCYQNDLTNAGLGSQFSENTPFEVSGGELNGRPRPAMLSLGVLLLSVISIAVSTSIRGTKEWFRQENQLKEIENKKLLAELSYLKAQINPHFFFNTLNSIYALAMQKSGKTPEVIMMLSGLMRYVIYDAKAPRVYLKKELAHISNLIDLQKMRLSEMVQIEYKVNGNARNIMIEPLLFTVLVENAFKHGIDYSKRNKIKIHVNIDDEELHFFVANPMIQKAQKVSPNLDSADSGIGLENIRKRLALLYPNRHELTILEKESLYIVELKLKLEKNKYEVYNN